MRACEDHSNTVVIYNEKYLTRCPLCEALDRISSLEEEVESLEDKVGILEDAELESKE